MAGITEEQMKNKEKIENMELVLENITCLRSFEEFVGLIELTVVRCKVDRIEGLKSLSKLKRLWLSENKISKLEGFEHSSQLEKLVLYNNTISKIDNLQGLTNLKELDLSQNKIEWIENLDCLHKLEILNLAMNQIEKVGTRLRNMRTLVELNLSGNKISNVEEIKHIREMTSLKVLYFFDPHFGENPICKIYNYQTYMLFHFDFLDKFDNLNINDESKKSAVIEFKKKRIYYNMRIKTLKRLFTTVEKILRALRDKKRDHLLAEIKMINLFIGLNDEKTKEIANHAINDKGLKIAEERLASRVFEQVKEYIYSELEKHINFITVELESTVRLEEGTNADRWYQSCINLVKSRFDPEDLADYGVQGINVHRVMRIHNRFLRNRFEEKVENYLDMSKPGYKKSFEYLFLGLDSSNPKEFYTILEKGYNTRQENELEGLVPYAGLYNTLFGADMARICSFVRSQSIADLECPNPEILRRRISTGAILVCKVVMVKPEKDPANPTFDVQQKLSEIYRSAPVSSSLTNNSEIIVSYRDSKQKGIKLDHKLYFIHEHTLILPEYMVEFNYETKEGDAQITHIGETLVVLSNPGLSFCKPGEDKLPDNKVDLIFKSKVEEVKLKYTDPKYKALDLQSIQFFSIDEFCRSGMEHLKIPLINYFTFFENNVNTSKNYKNEMAIIEQYKRQNAQLAELSQEQFLAIEKLEWACLGLDSVPFTTTLPKLKEVELSGNKLVSIDFVSLIPELERLNLACNLIEQLPAGLSGLKNLKSLDLSFNSIKDINQLKVLKDCPKLTTLSVRGNPFTMKFTKHIAILISMLPQVTELNESNIQKLREVSQMNASKSLTLDMIKDVKSETSQTEAVDLDLSSRNISSLQITNPFQEVKILNLSKNGLTKLDGIQFLTGLVELNVENNSLVDITDIGHLSQLKRLELGGNQISNLGHAFTGLKELVLLSLENNRISSLVGLSEMTNLLELYIGENFVDDLKEIRHLGGLKKLIVLDLWGNPLCREKEFRLFCIFNVKELKVLDGYPIQPKELEDSKQAFTGKLSDELLAEKLLGKNLETLVSLDLSSCNLRDFDNIFNNQKFPKIVEINLSGNFFTNLKCFGYLPTLKELTITDNRLASFEPLPDPKVRAGLAALPNLEVLQISKNRFLTLDTLRSFNLPRLILLKAASNFIKKISGISHLQNLRDLDLSSNRIKTLEPGSFDPSMKLEYLCLDENIIKSFNNLYLLPRLKHLFIRYNKVSDFNELEGLQAIPSLIELDLSNNPLSRKYGYRFLLLQKLPGLISLDGQNMTVEEREKLDILLMKDQGNKFQKPQPQPMLASAPVKQVKMSNITFEEVLPGGGGGGLYRGLGNN